MKWTKLLEYNREKNDAVRERYELAIERISQISGEESPKEPYRTYFVKTGAFLLLLNRLWERIEGGSLDHASLEEKRQWNQELFRDYAKGQFAQSYENSFYAVRTLGETYGRLLSALYEKVRRGISHVFQGRLDLLTIEAELFLEIYHIFQEDPDGRQVEQAIYWHNSDYTDVFEEDTVQNLTGVSAPYYEMIIRESGRDLSYLYDYGVLITDAQWKTAAYYSTLSQEEVDKIACDLTERYCSRNPVEWGDGCMRDHLQFYCDIGLERIAKAMIPMLEERGRHPVFCRSIHMRRNAPHDADELGNRFSCMDRQYKERRLQAFHTELERYKERIDRFAGSLSLYLEQEGLVLDAEDIGIKEPDCQKPIKRQEHCEKRMRITEEYARQRAQLMSSYFSKMTSGLCEEHFSVPENGQLLN